MLISDYMNMELSENSDDTLAQDVYRRLLKRFLDNEIVPGSVLNRKELARELDVSMAPLREALMMLTIEGFVETLPRKGTIARAINRKDVHGNLILREAIETQAARMYCGKPVRDNLETLLQTAEAVDSCEEELAGRWKCDLGLHLQLISLANCESLVVEFRKIMKIATFYHMNMFLIQEDRLERLSHVELIRSLTNDNPDETEAIIRNHLQSGKRHFIYDGARK